MGIKQLEDGLYYTDKEYLGEMVIQNSKQNESQRGPLKVNRVTSIDFANRRKIRKTNITTINHLTKRIQNNGKETNMKTGQDLEQETGKDMTQREY